MDPRTAHARAIHNRELAKTGVFLLETPEPGSINAKAVKACEDKWLELRKGPIFKAISKDGSDSYKVFRTAFMLGATWMIDDLKEAIEVKDEKA